MDAPPECSFSSPAYSPLIRALARNGSFCSIRTGCFSPLLLAVSRLMRGPPLAANDNSHVSVYTPAEIY